MNATQTRIAPQRAERQLERGQALIARARAEQRVGLYAEAEKYVKAAVRAFDVQDRADRLAIAQDALANCYWRRGLYPEARIVLRVALADLPAGYDYERGMLTVTLCQVERMEKKFARARELAEEISPLIEALTDQPLLRARFHSEFANVLNLTGDTDRAIIEYTAAAHHFEEAGHARHQAATDNNLAYLLVKVGRPADARYHLNRAQRYYEEVGDKSALGQLYETRARSFAATGDLPAAEDAARTSIRYLDSGEEKGLLAESYRTLAGILKAQGKVEEATASERKADELTEVKTRPRLRLCRSNEGSECGSSGDELEDADAAERFVMQDDSLSGSGVFAWDQLVVALGNSVRQGDPAVVESRGELFAGIYYKRDKEVTLEATNERYKDWVLDARDSNVLGRIVGYIKASDTDDDPTILLLET